MRPAAIALVGTLCSGVAACGGSTCDQLADAAVSCPYSGYHDGNVSTLEDACERNDRAAECMTDAYESHCSTASELLAALGACL